MSSPFPPRRNQTPKNFGGLPLGLSRTPDVVVDFLSLVSGVGCFLRQSWRCGRKLQPAARAVKPPSTGNQKRTQGGNHGENRSFSFWGPANYLPFCWLFLKGNQCTLLEVLKHLSQTELAEYHLRESLDKANRGIQHCGSSKRRGEHPQFSGHHRKTPLFEG